MIGIDLFSGCGGLSLGAKQAGINVVAAVELDSSTAATYSLNHPETIVYHTDIQNINRFNIAKNKRPDILFGGPPCRGFSTSNQRSRNSKNQTNWLFVEFFRFVGLHRPDWVVFENVTGLIDTVKGFFLKQIIDKFHSEGYAVSIWKLNAADFGVPQIRNRLFIIGSKKGIILETPEPTTAKYLTVSEAISDLPDLHNGASISRLPYKSKAKSAYAQLMRNGQQFSENHIVSRNSSYVVDRYRYIPQGGNWENIPRKLMKNYEDLTRCHTGIYRRLVEDKPSVVIGNYRKNMLIHPIQNRGLSVREAARLQSFPDWYTFKGSIGSQQQQVGNAVPPLLARWVFAEILKRY